MVQDTENNETPAVTESKKEIKIRLPIDGKFKFEEVGNTGEKLLVLRLIAVEDIPPALGGLLVHLRSEPYMNEDEGVQDKRHKFGFLASVASKNLGIEYEVMDVSGFDHGGKKAIRVEVPTQANVSAMRAGGDSLLDAHRVLVRAKNSGQTQGYYLIQTSRNAGEPGEDKTYSIEIHEVSDWEKPGLKARGVDPAFLT